MKKLCSILSAFLVTAFILVGCTSQSDSQAKDIPVTDILSAVEPIADIPNGIQILDEDTILSMYDIDPEMVLDMGLLKAGNGANADEIMVVSVKDTADSDTIKEAYALRLTVLMDLFADYTPADVPKIENAQMVQKGNYLLLAVCSDADAVTAAFEETLK